MTAEGRPSAGEIRTRAALPEEAPRLIANVLEGFEGYRAFAPPDWIVPPEDTPERVAELTERITDPASLVLVAEVDGVFAGHATLVPGSPDRPSADGFVPDFHLRHLFVREPYWGSGAARALHDQVVAFIGGGRARLFTPAGQARARRFYEREFWILREVGRVHAIGLPLAEYRR